MFKKVLLSLVVASGSLLAQGMFTPSEDEQELHVHNRVLAQVEGTPITVIDVMKKMDVIFYRQYPEYASSKPARFQFYQQAWKPVLTDLIDKELMKADAVEMKVEVTSSEVRQEMETAFGPNIIASLDKIDMTYDEASSILMDELLIRKMMMYKVNSKAFQAVGPNQVRQAYDAWAKENLQPETWEYRVISVRDPEPGAVDVSSRRISRLLREKQIPIDELKSYVKENNSLSSTTVLNVGELQSNPVDALSESYKSALEGLEVGQFSDPIKQKSKDDSTVYRIFCLVDKKEESLTPLAKVEPQLKNQLLGKKVEEFGKEYIKDLRQHFSVYEEKELLETFQPFSLGN